MVEVMKMMGPSSKGPVQALLNSGPPLCIRPLLTHSSARDSWTLTGKSGPVCLVGTLLLSPGSWCTQGFVCALQEFASPVLFKFWQLSGGVSGKLLQEGLCHTQVCSTQSTDSTADPYLRRRHPNTQRQVWLSLCGVSWCTEAFV